MRATACVSASLLFPLLQDGSVQRGLSSHRAPGRGQHVSGALGNLAGGTRCLCEKGTSAAESHRGCRAVCYQARLGWADSCPHGGGYQPHLPIRIWWETVTSLTHCCLLSSFLCSCGFSSGLRSLRGHSGGACRGGRGCSDPVPVSQPTLVQTSRAPLTPLSPCLLCSLAPVLFQSSLWEQTP